jgi:hypothetical protein
MADRRVTKRPEVRSVEKERRRHAIRAVVWTAAYLRLLCGRALCVTAMNYGVESDWVVGRAGVANVTTGTWSEQTSRVAKAQSQLLPW